MADDDLLRRLERRAFDLQTSDTRDAQLFARAANRIRALQRLLPMRAEALPPDAHMIGEQGE